MNVRRVLPALALAACARTPYPVTVPAPAEPAPASVSIQSEQGLRAALSAASGERKGVLQLRLAELLLPRVSYDARAATEVPILLAESALSLHTGDQRLWSDVQFANGRYWLEVREPSLSERVGRAQRHFDAAAFALVLPADVSRLALIHAWLGTAQMQLSQSSSDPEPHFRRARDHFTLARNLWRSVEAEAETEAMGHQIRRVDQAWSRHRHSP
jgi:hypothetical protein